MTGSARKPVRVLHVLGTSQPGGVETFVLNLAACIDRSRIDLSVCIANDDGPIAQELRALDIPVIVLGRSLPLTRGLRMYRSIAGSRCDIVHANIGGRMLRYVTRAAGCERVIVHLHGPPRDIGVDHPRASTYGRHATAAGDHVLVSSEAMLNWVRLATPELMTRTSRVYYGLDPAPFEAPAIAEMKNQLRSTFNIPKDAAVLGFVGRLVPQKGIRHLANIAAEVLRHRPDVHFMVAGDGPERSLLADLNASFADRVHMIGSRRDIPVVMHALDVLVVPSEWEPLGIVSIEAMLAGRPVVAFDVDGISEVVQHECTGFLASKADVETCVGHILRLLNDAQLRQRMGEAGRSRARERFNAAGMARELEEFYCRVSAQQDKA